MTLVTAWIDPACAEALAWSGDDGTVSVGPTVFANPQGIAPVYKFSSGEPITIGRVIVAGDATVYDVAALLKPLRSGRSVPLATDLPVAEFDVALVAAAGPDPSYWRFSLSAEQSALLKAGRYITDVLVALNGVTVTISQPATLRIDAPVTDRLARTPRAFGRVTLAAPVITGAIDLGAVPIVSLVGTIVLAAPIVSGTIDVVPLTAATATGMITIPRPIVTGLASISALPVATVTATILLARPIVTGAVFVSSLPVASAAGTIVLARPIVSGAALVGVVGVNAVFDPSDPRLTPIFSISSPALVAGVTPVLTPNDDIVAVSGSFESGWFAVRGNAPVAAGATLNYTLSVTGEPDVAVQLVTAYSLGGATALRMWQGQSNAGPFRGVALLSDAEQVDGATTTPRIGQVVLESGSIGGGTAVINEVPFLVTKSPAVGERRMDTVAVSTTLFGIKTGLANAIEAGRIDVGAARTVFVACSIGGTEIVIHSPYQGTTGVGGLGGQMRAMGAGVASLRARLAGGELFYAQPTYMVQGERETELASIAANINDVRMTGWPVILNDTTEYLNAKIGYAPGVGPLRILFSQRPLRDGGGTLDPYIARMNGIKDACAIRTADYSSVNKTISNLVTRAPAAGRYANVVFVRLVDIAITNGDTDVHYPAADMIDLGAEMIPDIEKALMAAGVYHPKTWPVLSIPPVFLRSSTGVATPRFASSTNTTAQCQFRADEDCEVRYVLLPAADAVPTRAAILASASVLNLGAGVETNLNLSALTSGTAYRLHAIAQADGSGTAIVSLSFATTGGAVATANGTVTLTRPIVTGIINVATPVAPATVTGTVILPAPIVTGLISSAISFSTWNNTFTGTVADVNRLVYSNGDKTVARAAGPASAAQYTRNTGGKSSGKYYVEVLNTAALAFAGVGSAAIGTSQQGGIAGTAGVDRVGLQSGTSTVTYSNPDGLGGTLTQVNVATIANGSVIQICVDVANELLWIRINNTGNWNGNASADPVTGTGGLSYRNVATDSHIVVGLSTGATASGTIRTDPAEQTYAAPSGFGAWTS